MESYILHIYRIDESKNQEQLRRKTDQYHMVGVVELVASERRIPFHSAEELWNLLAKNNRADLNEAG